jgi:hypothetical protein
MYATSEPLGVSLNLTDDAELTALRTKECGTDWERRDGARPGGVKDGSLLGAVMGARLGSPKGR